jgi:hypothetical protein
MSRSLSRGSQYVNTRDKNTDKFLGWEEALRDARAMLSQANLRRNQLREAIEIIEKKD